jgi:hypothetical protein
MPGDPNKLSQFWQELTRRKVIKVIAMYAATAFIILEVVDIVAPSLGLPDWTLNLVIVLLSVGFPITVILSWIFDVTPEGIKKTESIDELSEQEPTTLPTKRGLKTSDVIISVLIVAVCILLYPKIFKTDRFEDIRDADGNSGVFFRSSIEGTKITGWQAEVAPPGSNTGGIYESYGRGWLIKPEPEKDKALKFGDWNTMRIRVVDSKVTTWLNGQEMITLSDDKIGKATGSIALQIHSGGGIKVYWRNIKIQTLK